MTNSEIYNTIAESLQCDIDTNTISYEYASIINDIAYDKFITESELPENVESVLDRYISEASAEEMTDEDCTTLESYVEMIESITEAYDAGEITSRECDALYESVHEKIDVLTEGTLGAGGSRKKLVEVQLSHIRAGMRPITKAILDYYKREVYGNNTDDDRIPSVKPPRPQDLIKYCKLDENVHSKYEKAIDIVEEYTGVRIKNTSELCKEWHDQFSGIRTKHEFKKFCAEFKGKVDKNIADFEKKVKTKTAGIDANVEGKRKFNDYVAKHMNRTTWKDIEVGERNAERRAEYNRKKIAAAGGPEEF